MTKVQSDNRYDLLFVPLSHFGRYDIGLGGGKGANLGELCRAGFNVPSGFIITTAVYDLFLQYDSISSQLQNMLNSFDTKKPELISAVSRDIRYLFLNSEFPEPITSGILKAYRELGEGPVAVRSSATTEDLPDATFAGQQETYLNIIGEHDIIQAIRACWASSWSERAMLYRSRKNVDHSTVKVAIVVQEMIKSDTAGVMFTANPVSGARDELIIDASPGLGEAVVGGMVTPDHFVLSKHRLHIKEQQTGNREVIIHAKTGGGTEQVIPPQKAETTTILPSKALRELSKLGIAIERHFGVPQDIEWAWISGHMNGGELFILQARPITALPDPLKISSPMRFIIPLLAEMWPVRPYPIDMTTFTGAVENAIGNFLVTMIGKSAPNPGEALREEDGVVMGLKLPRVRPSPGFLFNPWIALWKTRRYNPLNWEADPSLADFLIKVNSLKHCNLSALTWTQVIDTIKDTLALVSIPMTLRNRYLPKALLGLGGLWLLLVITRNRNYFEALVSAVRTKTMETNQALENLASKIRSNQALKNLFDHHDTNKLLSALQSSPFSQAFLEQFNIFLDRYGHREISLTISQPTWKNQPNVVLAILKVLAETKSQPDDHNETWKHTRDKLLTRSIPGRWPLRNSFLKCLRHARCFFQIREDTHFYVTQLQPILRCMVLELGSRLVQIGVIKNNMDIFHLRFDELESIGDPWPPSNNKLDALTETLERRKRKRESVTNTPMIDPRLLDAVSLRVKPEGNVLLRGASGSRGIARGPARIVNDPTEFGKLKAGDVLVAPVTNPAWTPLFQRAAAVVVDTGGMASHAAIVAREYGIPAVMGTINGTSKLVDNQWLEVDGSRGLVVKIDKHI